MKTMKITACLIVVVGCTDNLTPSGDLDPPITTQCTPNVDGVIEAREFVQLGYANAVVLASTPGSMPAVDLRGLVDSQGRITWPFADPDLGTTPTQVVALPIGDRWYASSFPGAQFAFTSSDGAFDYIYSQTADSVYLHGTASTLENPSIGQTLVPYELPVQVYKFPLVVGTRSTIVAQIPMGRFNGGDFSGKALYEISDDAAGYMELPDLTLTQVHRVRFTITNQPDGGTMFVTRQVNFLFECFGEVARVVSQPNETQDDFTTAAEVRRFTVRRP